MARSLSNAPAAQRSVEHGGDLSGRVCTVIGEGASASAIRELLTSNGARLLPEAPDRSEPGLDVLVFVA